MQEGDLRRHGTGGYDSIGELFVGVVRSRISPAAMIRFQVRRPSISP
jgi:hypothetical protein